MVLFRVLVLGKVVANAGVKRATEAMFATHVVPDSSRWRKTILLSNAEVRHHVYSFLVNVTKVWLQTWTNVNWTLTSARKTSTVIIQKEHTNVPNVMPHVAVAPVRELENVKLVVKVMF